MCALLRWLSIPCTCREAIATERRDPCSNRNRRVKVKPYREFPVRQRYFWPRSSTYSSAFSQANLSSSIDDAERDLLSFGSICVTLGLGLSKSGPNPYFSLKRRLSEAIILVSPTPFLFNLAPCPFLPMDLLRIRIPTSTNLHLSGI